MSKIDQHSALLSTIQALDTNQELVDSRREIDHLNFMVKFSSLLNYYNGKDQVAGEWSSFLLKDPVFLTAHIAKVDVGNYETLFSENISVLEKESLGINKTLKNTEKLKIATVELFNIYFDIYSHLEKWTIFLQLYPKKYLLRDFILNEVKDQYSPILWSLWTLRNQLYNRSLIPKPSVIRPYTFEETTQYCWTSTKGLMPYWRVLELKEDFSKNSFRDILTSLRNNGNKILSFLKQIVLYSNEEYKSLNLENSLYPDTTLLRAFVDLLNPYREQLNDLSKSHLNYYYDSVLKQKSLGVQRDSVFVSLSLAKDQLFSLPSQTKFTAGKYEDGSPILFENAKSVELNPAIISTTYTLSKEKSEKGLERIYLKNNENVSTVNRSETGQVAGWDTFGSNSGTSVNFGFILGSPLLLLKEGERKITFDFCFSNKVEKEFLYGLSFYLSTKEKWYKLTYKHSENLSAVTDNSCTFNFKLKVTEPPIEPFLVSPDGLSSDWAQIKMEFDEVGSFSMPLAVKSVELKVHVKNTSDFTLSNDLGALDSTKPFQPLGPTPNENSNFYLGSSEIFSKPLESLQLNYNWNNLPDNFIFYYFEYSLVLISEFILNSNSGDTKIKPVDRTSLLRQAFFFNNYSFKVDFSSGSVLKETTKNGEGKNSNDSSIWKNFPLKNKRTDSKEESQYLFSEEDNNKSSATSSGNTDTKQKGIFGILKFLLKLIEEIILIFETIKIIEFMLKRLKKLLIKVTASLSSKSSFEYVCTNKIGFKYFDPYVQLKPLKMSEGDASGFIRMKLTGPIYGFGSVIYSKVISIISLFNASQLIEQKEKPKETINPANPPFAPKLDSIRGNYTASFTYLFDYEHQHPGYPLECFYTSPFGNYKVYDSTNETKSFRALQGVSIGSISNEVDNLPLYPSLEYDRTLFLPISNAIPNSTLSLYFELASNYGQSLSKEGIYFHYLSETSWKPFTIQSDTTKSLKCSGILSFSVPTDSSESSMLMDESARWVALGINDKELDYPQTVYLNTNGVLLKRAIDTAQQEYDPNIPESAVLKTFTAIPELATIAQPFPSIGGRKKENASGKNVRISNRLYTKDRLLTRTDFYRTLLEQFDTLFYVKVVQDSTGLSTNIFCVKKVANLNDANSFLPFVNACDQSKIASFIAKRSSPFSKISVLNFKPEYIKVIAQVAVNQAPQIGALSEEIDNQVKLFLAPWIVSEVKANSIDSSITTAKIASLIMAIDGVKSINTLKIQRLSEDSNELLDSKADGQKFSPAFDEMFVPSMFNRIKCVVDE
jgi:hypothetical protein